MANKKHIEIDCHVIHNKLNNAYEKKIDNYSYHDLFTKTYSTLMTILWFNTVYPLKNVFEYEHDY